MNKLISRVKHLGFVQALSVFLYCSLVGIIFWKGNNLFGRTPNYFAPVFVLILFSLSALICGVLVFYKPYKLFFYGKKKEAADLVLSTTVWLLVFFLLFLILAVFAH